MKSPSLLPTIRGNRVVKSVNQNWDVLKWPKGEVKGKDDAETLQKFDTTVPQQNFDQTQQLLHSKAEKRW